MFVSIQIDLTPPPNKEIFLHGRYAMMCQFFSGELFVHPAVAKYDFLIRLDDDAIATAPLLADVIELMDAEGAYIGAPELGWDWPPVLAEVDEFLHDHFREEVRKSAIENPLFYYKKSDEVIGYTRLLFNTAIVVFDARFYRTLPVRHFYQTMKESGLQLKYRWGDHAMTSLMAALFGNHSSTRYLPEINCIHKDESHFGHTNVDKKCRPKTGIDCYLERPAVMIRTMPHASDDLVNFLRLLDEEAILSIGRGDVATRPTPESTPRTPYLYHVWLGGVLLLQCLAKNRCDLNWPSPTCLRC